LTYDIAEAKLVVGKVGTKRRAELELRTRGLWTEENRVVNEVEDSKEQKQEQEPPRKRARVEESKKEISVVEDFDDGSTTESEAESQLSIRVRKRPQSSETKETVPVVLDGSTTASEGESQERKAPQRTSKPPRMQSPTTPSFSISRLDFVENVRVLKLQWLEDTLKAGEILPLEFYLVYYGRPISRPPEPTTPQKAKSALPQTPTKVSPVSQHNFAESILDRARADVSAGGHSQQASYAPAPHGIRRFRDQGKALRTHHDVPHQQQKSLLLHMTTSEYDGSDCDIPPAPDWVKKGLKYSCQRSTLANPPNEAFNVELKKIILARLLTGDEIGVRAYSSASASVAAYPHLISSAKEMLSLPGCDVKVTNLWIEWKNTGVVAAAEEADKDENLKILKQFYDIWGVGATTAREFYFEKGWRDLDDVVEYGWKDLSRVQQIGVKYYNEFLLGIPRAEVEFIAAKVKEHAIKVCDSGVELLVVGGYRRGKQESGDVDIIVSHRDLRRTLNLVNDIVASLETAEWITHTLTLALTSSHRGQSTLPFKSQGVASHGSGFDTLDKALVVWQDPHWPTKAADLAQTPKMKNPNLHRRVDIIVAPWRTVGCAVVGWSGGTTFQRDLRRYAKHAKGWKFDSSGVRSRSTGEVVQLEGKNGVEGSMVDAEKKVFEGLGLVYREPWERCTG